MRTNTLHNTYEINKLKEILKIDGEGYFNYRKEFAHLFGKDLASIIVLSYLVSLAIKFNRLKFYHTDKQIADAVGLSVKVIKRVKNRLRTLDFLKISTDGLHNKTYYEFNLIELIKFYNPVKAKTEEANMNKSKIYEMSNNNTEVTEKGNELSPKLGTNKIRNNNNKEIYNNNNNNNRKVNNVNDYDLASIDTREKLIAHHIRIFNRQPSPFELYKLEEFVNKYGFDRVITAMETTRYYGKYGLAYVEGVLENRGKKPQQFQKQFQNVKKRRTAQEILEYTYRKLREKEEQKQQEISNGNQQNN